jgi:hypothetical protein
MVLSEPILNIKNHYVLKDELPFVFRYNHGERSITRNAAILKDIRFFKPLKIDDG